jgi:hypothetical protein
MRYILPLLVTVTGFSLFITLTYIELLKRPTAIVELLEIKHDLIP